MRHPRPFAAVAHGDNPTIWRRTAFIILFLFAAQVRAEISCEALAGTAVGNGVVLEAISVSESLTLSSRFGGQATVTGPACIVRGQIKPTADSDIRFEVWLPA